MKKNVFRLTTIGMLSATMLAGCGGGGGGSTTAAPTPPSTPSNPAPPPSSSAPLVDRLALVTPEQVETNQSISLIAMVESGAEITQSTWTQTTGPAVTFLADNSQVIGFDVSEAGEYTFSYQGTDSNGTTAQQEVNFSVQQGSNAANAMVRLDHAVTETGKVSFRVDSSDPNNAIASVAWTQIAGPTLTSSQLTAQENFLFFDAPDVNQDQLIEFQAAVTFANGNQDTDSAFVLVKNTEVNNGGFFPDAAGRIVSEDVYAYRPQSQYANVLVDCVYNNQIDTSCSFGALPLIGQAGVTVPSVDAIMQRVVVSHDWMAERFREYLTNSPVSEDIRQLLNAVTAIVISVDVRPSFYWAATGAIYLDADNFWVTPEERDTLNDVPDFRSAFGGDLQFIMPWRYAQDGVNYLNRNSYSRVLRETRTQEDVQADITWLLFHELAHANDFFNPAIHQSLPNNSSPLLWANDNPTSSDELVQSLPLASNELSSLAQVSFAGETANATQRNYDAADIENFFRPDGAAIYYGFFTRREDYATIFERFMMAHRLGVDADVAVISTENNPNFLVQWGQRNRINETQVKARTQFVVNSIYPSLNVEAALNNLPAPQNMVRGVSWFDNLMNTTPSSQNVGVASGTNANASFRLGPHDNHRARPGMPKIK